MSGKSKEGAKMSEKELVKTDTIQANCSLCGNTSSYCPESLAGSTYNINEIDQVPCGPCVDDLNLMFGAEE